MRAMMRTRRLRGLEGNMPAAVDSAFDVAFWFADMALNENEYL